MCKTPSLKCEIVIIIESQMRKTAALPQQNKLKTQ